MHLTEIDSTNNHLKRLLAEEILPDGFTVSADYQTAGRGQHGNGWESEAGKNLLFTTLFRLHEIPISSQFLLSQLVPLAIVQPLNSQFSILNSQFTIKWPNDIYYGDKKLAGILIEHSLAGRCLDWSIAGIGINVNQMEFHSPAPNPISLRQALQTTEEIDKFALLQAIQQQFVSLRPLLQQPDELKRLYMANLYRREGYYPYLEAAPSSAPIMPTHKTEDAFYAKIEDVLSDGRLVLCLESGEKRTYHFKEVRYCI